MPAAGTCRQAAAVLASLSFEQRMACGLLALFALLPPAASAFVGNYTLLLAERATILAIAALSLELLVGTGGLLSFGHAAFLGIGRPQLISQPPHPIPGKAYAFAPLHIFVESRIPFVIFVKSIHPLLVGSLQVLLP